MITITPKLKLHRPEGTDKATRELFNANIDAMEENAASQEEFASHLAEGSNNEVIKQKRLVLKTDTRSVTPTYTNGNLTQVAEKDGVTIIKTTTLNYDIYSVLQNIVEVAGGKTVTTTFNYSNGKFAGTTKVVT